MNARIRGACLALLAGIASPLTAQNTVLQWGFDAATGDVAVPVDDDSGAPLRPGSNLIHAGAAPVYSADTPTVGALPGQARAVTGIGSVSFTGTAVALSTAASAGVGSGQGIVTAADISAAGGLTMEVWVKNPSSNSPGSPGAAVNYGGMYVLGINGNRIGFFGGDNSDDLSWSTGQFEAGEWNHLAVVMTTADPSAMAFSNISAYLNGVEINSAAHTFPWFLDRAFSMGNHQYGSWTDYEGLAYEPRVSLGVLTPDQFTVVPPAGGLTAPESVEHSTNGGYFYFPVTVSNISASTYHVTGVSFAGPDAASFGDGGNVLPLEVPASGTADVFVDFTPGAGGLAEATLTLTTDDPNAPTLEVDLSIEVRDPEIRVVSDHDFGLFLFPPGPTAHQITVENLGWANDLVLGNPQITGPGAAAFSVTYLPAPFLGSDVLEVTFNPTVAGAYPASLELTTNDPYHPTVTIGLSGQLAGGGTQVMQWGFDATTGEVIPPVNDDSGNGKDGTHVLFGAAPTCSADIPGASMRQNATGAGSVDFTGTSAAISTADSAGVGSGQGIVTATDVYNAGGLTMEVWVRGPSSNSPGAPGAAVNFGGMYILGLNGNRLGFFGGDNSNDLSWSTDQFVAGEWNHLAVTMTTDDPAAMEFKNISAYLNGMLIQSAAHAFPWFLDRAVSVGNHQWGSMSDFEGLVYEPRVSLGTLAIGDFTMVPGLRTLTSVIGQSYGEDTSLPVTVNNSSPTARQVTGVAFTGADAAAFSGSPTLPLTVPAGGSSELMVDFAPIHGGGSYTATLTLTTDDPNNPTLVVTLTVVVAGADTGLIRVTATSLVSPTRMRIDFEGRANTVYQVKSSADLQQPVFTGAVAVAVDGLTTNDTGGGRGAGFVEFDITVPGRMFYQIQEP